MEFDDPSDPTKCQAKMGKKRLSYMTFHADADTRMKKGQKQTLCSVCERWRWKDERCPDYKVGMTQEQFDEMMTLCDQEGVQIKELVSND